MILWVKLLAIKHNYLSLNPRIHVVGDTSL